MNFLNRKQFYKSKEWKIFRQQLILDRCPDGPVCEECNEKIVVSKHIQVDHNPIELTDENVNDVNISLNPDNAKISCLRCHNKRHDRFSGPNEQRRIKKSRNVYIVYGPPMSGKNTYVREHMKVGDLVVDMDNLFRAVSMQPLYDKPEGLKYIVFSLRNILLDNIKTRYGKWDNAWIVGGYADKYVRDKLCKDVGAELIYIKADKDDCLYRLSYCNDYRQQHKTEWTQYIEEWFENFSE